MIGDLISICVGFVVGTFKDDSRKTPKFSKAALLTALAVFITSSTLFAQSTSVDLLVNSGFETGVPSIPWTESTLRGRSLMARGGPEGGPHSGNWQARLGGTNSEHDVLTQTVIIPSGADRVNLSFFYSIKATGNGHDPSQSDSIVVELRDPDTNGTLASIVRFTSANETSGWVQAGPFDLTAFRGLLVSLAFDAVTNSAKPTSFFVDDVNLSMIPSAGPSVVDLAYVRPIVGCRLSGSLDESLSISGLFPIEVQAASNDGIASLSISLDGQTIATTTDSRLSTDLDTAALSDGTHVLEAQVTSTSGALRICPVPITPTQVIADGDFEPNMGNFGWYLSGKSDARQLVVSDTEAAPYSKLQVARFGGRPNADEELLQTFSIPVEATQATLSLYSRVYSDLDTTQVIDTLTVSIQSLTDDLPPIELLNLSNLNATDRALLTPGGYTLNLIPLDLPALGLSGSEVLLSFHARTSGRIKSTTFLVDGLGLSVGLSAVATRGIYNYVIGSRIDPAIRIPFSGNCDTTWYDPGLVETATDATNGSTLALLAQGNNPAAKCPSNPCASPACTSNCPVTLDSLFPGTRSSSGWTLPAGTACPAVYGKFTGSACPANCPSPYPSGQPEPLASPSIVKVGTAYYMAFVAGNADFKLGRVFWAKSTDGLSTWQVRPTPILTPKYGASCALFGVAHVDLNYVANDADFGGGGGFYFHVQYYHFDGTPDLLAYRISYNASDPVNLNLGSQKEMFECDTTSGTGCSWQPHTGIVVWTYEGTAADDPRLKKYCSIGARGFEFGMGDIAWDPTDSKWLHLWANISFDSVRWQKAPALSLRDASGAHSLRWGASGSAYAAVDTQNLQSCFANSFFHGPGLFRGPLTDVSQVVRNKWWAFFPVRASGGCGSGNYTCSSIFAGLGIARTELNYICVQNCTIHCPIPPCIPPPSAPDYPQAIPNQAPEVGARK